MMKLKAIFLFGALLGLSTLLYQCQTSAPVQQGPVQFDAAAVPYPVLSDYAFFQGKMERLEANERVLPYDLITPLFTDYAHKKRFVWMPEGVQATVDDEGILQFPDEAVLIKNFYYPADFQQPEEDWDIIETRLLMKVDGAWQAYTYVWNEEQTDAKLNLIGDFKTVSWKNEVGIAQTIEYAVPNKNQCKSCHNRENVLQPIGPKVRHLNHAFTYTDGSTKNQLQAWQEAGYLASGSYEQFTPVANWEDSSQPLEARALAYLDTNCGHCHDPKGPANTTGLYLHAYQTDPTQLGIHKPPVAAGKGSGGRRYSIEPGQPDSSILVYRMESDDPGIMMPELGRVVAHAEGVALIREWIVSMSDIQ
jgi:uncharacterized repeat protein (TIGR03806 family)